MTPDYDYQAVGQALVQWYARHQRDLPWRHTDDPYAIWVSEVMLAQTQVTTAIPYYRLFMALFPTVKTLAGAELDQVLKAWEGLGYYSRARNLHAAAQQVVGEHGAKLPDDPKSLRALPGIGPYTAGAILSIAFGQDAVAVDGNVRRVLSRVFHIVDDITEGSTQRHVEQLAQRCLPPGCASDYNQALMDLGATLCLPKQPRCLLCPLQTHCEGHRLGIASMLPVRPPRKQVPHYEVAAAVIWRDQSRAEFLIAQRPLEGLLGGLWEFPGGKREQGESLAQCLRREIEEELGLLVNVGELLTVVAHAYTHFRITMHAFHCWRICDRDIPQPIQVADWRWIRLAQVDDFAFSAADHKVIAALQDDIRGGASIF